MPLSLSEDGTASWRAVLAVALMALRGIIVWAVRRRQRRIREQTIAAIRRMLRDRVPSKLGIVLMQLELVDDIDERQRETLVSAQRNVAAVTEPMGDLSSESLRAWQKRFDAFERRSDSAPQF